MSSPEDMSFLEKLEALMAKYNLSVKEISRTVGVPNSTVMRWLSGRSKPHPAVEDNVIGLIHTVGETKVSMKGNR